VAREGGPWRLWLAGALGLTGLVVAAAVPALRQPVLVAAQAGTAVVVLVSARSRRPAVARLWWAAPGWFLVSALLGARVLAAGGATPLTRALAPGTVIGLLAVVLPEELRARRARPRDASRHQWADGAIVLAGAGLLAGRSASGVSLDPDVAGDPLRVLTAATGLVAFGMLGWVVTARRDPPAATLLISSACAVFVLTQTWLALSPASSAAATAPQALVLTAATVLFALGTLAPSTVAVGTAPVAPRAGLGSRRITVLLPFAVVPSAVKRVMAGGWQEPTPSAPARRAPGGPAGSPAHRRTRRRAGGRPPRPSRRPRPPPGRRSRDPA
jgi:hypothetical protein